MRKSLTINFLHLLKQQVVIQLQQKVVINSNTGNDTVFQLFEHEHVAGRNTQHMKNVEKADFDQRLVWEAP